jgi:hypothetical protein
MDMECVLCAEWGYECKGDVELREIMEIIQIDAEGATDANGIILETLPGAGSRLEMCCSASAEAHDEGVDMALCMMFDDIEQIDHWGD